MSVRKVGGWVGVLGSRLCCQQKADSCSLMEGSLLVLETFFVSLLNTMLIQPAENLSSWRVGGGGASRES